MIAEIPYLNAVDTSLDAGTILGRLGLQPHAEVISTVPRHVTYWTTLITV